MALIIKDTNADFSANPNAKPLLLDPLTVDGTILLLDFSRKSCVPNSLKKGMQVNDLSKGGSELDNDTTFKVTSVANQNFDFIDNGSYLLRNTSATNGENTGIDLGQDIQNYLRTNNVQNAVFIFWIYQVANSANGFAMISSSTSDEIGTKNIIRILAQNTGNCVFTIAGAATNPVSISDSSTKHRQIAIIYKQGEPLTVYKSKSLHSYSANNAGTWGVPNSNLIVGQNAGVDSNLSTTKLGRVLIEDLDRSGRTALDVINEDYDYVNALGKYAGIEPRPFSSL